MTPEVPVEPVVSCFVDEVSRPWEVREIRDYLSLERRSPLSASAFANGWLLFTSGVERRRFAPLPPGWRNADQELLRRWCREAMPVPSSQS